MPWELLLRFDFFWEISSLPWFHFFKPKKVNYKDPKNENDRSRAPEYLAHYADLILKKKGPEEVGDKIDEIIKCLEFVAEKDIFQSKFRQRHMNTRYNLQEYFIRGKVRGAS